MSASDEALSERQIELETIIREDEDLLAQVGEVLRTVIPNLENQEDWGKFDEALGSLKRLFEAYKNWEAPPSEAVLS